MPAVTLEDPYPLAHFTTTTSTALSNDTLAVSCTPVDVSPLSSVISDSASTTDSDLVALTVQGEGVDLYNVTDQKCIKSWSTPPGLTFACSAKYHTKDASRYVYAVVASGSDVSPKEESKIVWMWHDKDDKGLSLDAESEAGLATKTVKKFDRRIFSLQVSPVLPSYIVLINQDGSISLVPHDLKRVAYTCEHPTSTQTSTVLWSTIFVTSSDFFVPTSILPASSTIIVTVTSSKAKVVSWALNFFYVDLDQRSVEVLATVDVEAKDADVESATPLAFSLDPSTGHVSALSSVGVWAVYQLHFTATATNTTRVSLAETLALPLQGFTFGNTGFGERSSSEKKSPRKNSVAIAPLKDSYLALVGARKRQENGKLEHVLNIWDVRYGTLQAERVVNATSDGGAESAWMMGCTYSLTPIPNSHLVLTLSVPTSSTSSKRSTIVVSKTTVLLCPYYCAPMSLLGAMNKMQSTVGYLLVDGHGTKRSAKESAVGILRSGIEAVGKNLPYQELPPEAAYEMWVTNLTTLQELEAAILKRLLDPSATPSANKFARAFLDYVNERTKVAEQERRERHGVDDGGSGEDENDDDEGQWESKVVNGAGAMDVDKNRGTADTKMADVKGSNMERVNGVKYKARKDDGDKRTRRRLDNGDGKSSSEDGNENEEENDDERKWEQYQQELAEWRKLGKKTVKRLKKKSEAKKQANKPLPDLSHNFILRVTSRCFTRLPNGSLDTSFWPVEVVKYMIENEFMNSNCVEGGIVKALVERSDWTLLELALKSLHDIPELDLVFLLKHVHALSIPTNNATNTPSLSHFLSLIILAPRNDLFMQQALKRLTVEELTAMLETMSKWVDWWEAKGGVGFSGMPPMRKTPVENVPGFPLILDYLTLLLDTHFPTLILTPALHPLLTSLTTHIKTELAVCDRMEELRGALGLFRRKDLKTERMKKEANTQESTRRRRKNWEGGQGIPDYGVEIIHL